jgi:ribosome-associated toxin RatA of RatAB toxin-antitoxin module
MVLKTMTIVNKSALVPYTSSQMFDLVNHIETYPEFLPWCKSTTVHHRDEEEVKASLLLAWSGLQKSFTTHNRMQKDKMIEIRLIEGPFQHLEGFWRFETLTDQSSKVMFDLEFEFSNRLIRAAFGPIFSQVTNALVDAFCQRAENLYGKK